jgi:esterase/lipase superfamily enzyme
MPGPERRGRLCVISFVLGGAAPFAHARRPARRPISAIDWVICLFAGGQLPKQNRFAAAAGLALVLLCCSCASRPLQGVLVPNAQSADGATRVPILVATTRERSVRDPGELFSTDRAPNASYASIVVSIPPDSTRKVGEVQWPLSLPGDPQRDFVTVSADYLGDQSFSSALTVEVKQTRRSKVLVFVHGFNNRFDEAVYRLAQIVHDSNAPAIPVLFSWPSRGDVRLVAYTSDRESASSSSGALEKLLDTISQNPNVKEITVLAHSMGCGLTLEALRARAIRSGSVGDKIKNVLLVAPDVSVDVFPTEIQQMGNQRPRVALFVSQDDPALKLSRMISGGIQRVGDINPDEEPYRSEFQRLGIMVFDLSHLQGDAHSRAFEDITSVMGMIEQRLAAGQQLASSSDAGR